MERRKFGTSPPFGRIMLGVSERMNSRADEHKHVVDEMVAVHAAWDAEEVRACDH